MWVDVQFITEDRKLISGGGSLYEVNLLVYCLIYILLLLVLGKLNLPLGSGWCRAYDSILFFHVTVKNHI